MCPTMKNLTKFCVLLWGVFLWKVITNIAACSPPAHAIEAAMFSLRCRILPGTNDISRNNLGKDPKLGKGLKTLGTVALSRYTFLIQILNLWLSSNLNKIVFESFNSRSEVPKITRKLKNSKIRKRTFLSGRQTSKIGSKITSETEIRLVILKLLFSYHSDGLQ